MKAPRSPSWPVSLSCTIASEGLSCGLRSCDHEQAATALAERVVRDPLPFLVTAGEILAGSLDYEQTLHRLLDIVVPTLADMCSIHLLDDDGRFRRIAARHHTAEAAALSDGLTDHYMDSGERDGPIHRLLASATSLLSSPVTDADLDLIVGAERRTQIVQHIGVTSAMVVPLTARGRPFGVLCMSTAVRPRFELAHLHLAEEIGRRGALALDSALLYRAVRQSQLATERARQRTAFLAEASATLAASLDIRTTLQTVVQLAVPRLAESCSLAVAEDDGSMRRLALAHADPERQRLIDAQSPIIPTNGQASHPMAVVLATGRPLVDNAVTDETRRSYANGEYLELLRRLDIRARLVVPLEARGRRIGTLTFSSSDPARAFDEDDVALGVELAGRAALALDNARLYQEARILNDRLAEQLDLSDAVVRNIAEGIMVVDRDWRITYVNPVAGQLLGRSRDDLIGRNAHEIALARDETGAHLPGPACRIREVLLTGRTVRLDDEVFIRADGEMFPVALSSSPLTKDGRVVGAVTIFRDVSDRKRHREALQRSEERLRRALASAGMVMWEHDFATGRTVRSDLASALYGRPNDELMDDPAGHERLVHPEDREYVRVTQQGAVRSGVGYEVDYRVLWPDGTVRWLSSRASIFRNAHGRPLGMSGTTHDITARKQAELDNSRLLDERQAEAEELRQLHRRLQRSLAALLGLHEVGTLLTSASDLDAVGRRVLEIAVRAARLRGAALRRKTGRGRVRLWQRVGPAPDLSGTSRAGAVARARARSLASGQPSVVQVRRGWGEDDELTAWCVPLVVKGEVLGILEAFGEPRPADEPTLEILGSIALQAATALENARLYREVADSERALRRLVHQLMGAQEDERRRLAYEIHDGFAQTASGVQQLVEAYAHDFPGASEAARNRMDVAIGLARRTVSEIRRVLAGLRPTVLDDFGLARGLRAYVDGLAAENLTVTFAESVGVRRLGADVEIALFRLAQEALTNVRKHAQVREARLRLHQDGDQIVLEVEDSGSGFDLTAVRSCDRPGEHLGLLSMTERIAQVGGSVEIRSRCGEGTLVRAVVPVAGLLA
jgi:PAS domain S-box-containing protein